MKTLKEEITKIVTSDQEKTDQIFNLRLLFKKWALGIVEKTHLDTKTDKPEQVLIAIIDQIEKE